MPLVFTSGSEVVPGSCVAMVTGSVSSVGVGLVVDRSMLSVQVSNNCIFLVTVP